MSSTMHKCTQMLDKSLLLLLLLSTWHITHDVKKEVYIGLRIKLLHFYKSGNTSGRIKRLGRERKRSMFELMFCI